MKQKLLIVAMTCIAVLTSCTDQPVATGDALAKICVERKVLKQALEKSETTFLQCLQNSSKRTATGTDDEADIVEQCRTSAFRLNGVYEHYTTTDLMDTNKYAVKCGEQL